MKLGVTASGISAVTRVPPPGGLTTFSTPPSASTRSASPCRPGTARRVGAADAVVGDDDDQAAVARRRPRASSARREAYFATLASASAQTK